MKKENIIYKEIENRNGSTYNFFKNNVWIATVENDILYEFDELTEEEKEEIKKIASL